MSANRILIYGVHAIKSRLKAHADSVQTVYCLKGKDTSPRAGELKALMHKKGHDFVLLNKDVFKEMLVQHQLDDVVHQNVLAFCDQSTNFYEEHDLESLVQNCEKPPFILILDNVQDPHNFGACIRSSEAANVDFIIFPKDKSAPINATVEKVASGAMSAMKLVSVTNLARSLDILKDKGVWITGLAGEADQLLYDVDLTGAVALVMGSEEKGMRAQTRAKCDYLAKLPMLGKVSSLNVSVAAGVSMYEVVRQRR